MDSAEELQQLEITALQSIYAQDFIDCPPPTVWKVVRSFILDTREMLTLYFWRAPPDCTNSSSKYIIQTQNMPPRLVCTYV